MCRCRHCSNADRRSAFQMPAASRLRPCRVPTRTPRIGSTARCAGSGSVAARRSRPRARVPAAETTAAPPPVPHWLAPRGTSGAEAEQMTYRQFLVFALAPGVAIVTTLLIARISAAGEPAAGRVRRDAAVVLGLAVGAVVYTTPWDGWMIRRSVWWYPPDSVVDTAVRVPVEEYLF